MTTTTDEFPKGAHAGAHARRDRTTRPTSSRVARACLIGLGVLLALVIIGRLVLDPIATRQTRKALDQLNGFEGEFQRVHVTLLSPGYDITNLKLTPSSPAGASPIFYAARTHLGVRWRDLLRLRLVASLRIDHPKVTIVQVAGAPKKAHEKAAAPDLTAQLHQVTALKVDRIEVFDGELLFRARDSGNTAELWIHHLELAAENLATRSSLADGRPATVAAHAEMGHGGKLTLFVSADPFASPLAFAGRVAVTGFAASDLYEFVAPSAHLQASKGTIDIFSDFVSKGGLITGGVKPVLKNIEIRPTEGNPWDRAKAWLADKSIELTSDRIPERNAVASTIPIKGRLTDPKVELWPTVLGVIRNAFVRGLASGFANVPPATSPQKEGVLTQVKHALTKDHGPPKAEPVKP